MRHTRKHSAEEPYACKQCPLISLALLDARVGIRRELGVGSRERRDMKWSDTKGIAAQVL